MRIGVGRGWRGGRVGGPEAMGGVGGGGSFLFVTFF